MKTYIFSYNLHDELDDEELDGMLKSIFSNIGDFKKDMAFTFIIASDRNANFIADEVIKKIPKLRFFITEITDNRQGWLPKETWEFIKTNC